MIFGSFVGNKLRVVWQQEGAQSPTNGDYRRCSALELYSNHYHQNSTPIVSVIPISLPAFLAKMTCRYKVICHKLRKKCFTNICRDCNLCKDLRIVRFSKFNLTPPAIPFVTIMRIHFGQLFFHRQTSKSHLQELRLLSYDDKTGFDGVKIQPTMTGVDHSSVTGWRIRQHLISKKG